MTVKEKKKSLSVFPDSEFKFAFMFDKKKIYILS